MIYILEPRLPANETQCLWEAESPGWEIVPVIFLCGTRAYRERMAIDPTDTLNYDRERLIQEQDQ